LQILFNQIWHHLLTPLLMGVNNWKLEYNDRYFSVMKWNWHHILTPMKILCKVRLPSKWGLFCYDSLLIQAAFNDKRDGFWSIMRNWWCVGIMGKSGDTKYSPKSCKPEGLQIVVTIRQTMISLTQDIGRDWERNLECFLFFQKGYKAVHQLFTACSHVSLKSLQWPVPGDGHDVIGRITAFIEIGDATSSSGMKTDHLPFG